MKLKKNLRRSSNTRKAPLDWTRRQALLAATASDERRGGMPGCTIREVIQAINALPA